MPLKTKILTLVSLYDAELLSAIGNGFCTGGAQMGGGGGGGIVNNFLSSH